MYSEKQGRCRHVPFHRKSFENNDHGKFDLLDSAFGNVGFPFHGNTLISIVNHIVNAL